MANTLEILLYPNPILKQKALPVTDITGDIIDFAGDLAETMVTSSHGVGLAAPQVGVLKRIVAIKVPSNDKDNNTVNGKDYNGETLILINPEITGLSKYKKVREGCLSVPNYLGTLKRAKKVTARALNIDGKEIVIQSEGLMAVCLQHEIDHLDGILFLDRIINPKTDLKPRKY